MIWGDDLSIGLEHSTYAHIVFVADSKWGRVDVNNHHDNVELSLGLFHSLSVL